MNPRKGFLISLLTVAALLLCVFAMPQAALAAGEGDLTFTLNATGDGYIVSACDNAATGELVIPGTYMGKPVTGIGDRAFYGCTGLTGVTIPDSVQSFGDWAFFGCLNLSYNEYRYGKYLGNANNPYMILVGITSNGLTKFTVHPDTLAIDAFVFSQCPGLASITIPNKVTSIGSVAFAGCSLTAITIPDSVTTISDYAFLACSQLKSVSLGSGLTGIGLGAFSNCSALTGIVIPDSVTSLADSAFFGCTGLSSVTIGKGVTQIGSQAFQNCTGLTSVILGSGVSNIGSKAFAGCTGLTGIHLPISVTTIGSNAFDGCAKLTKISIPDSVTSIGDRAFQGCPLEYTLYDNGKYLGNGSNPYVVLVETASKDMTSFTIHPQTKILYQDALRDCSKLSSIVIPHRVTNIGANAIYHCAGLTNIVLPNSLLHIGQVAFGENTKLSSVIYCGTKEQWDNIVTPAAFGYNGTSTSVTIQFHNMVNGQCTICGPKNRVPGDMDGNGNVTYHDAVYLLLNLFFGEAFYPLDGAQADFDGNGIMDHDDPVYLLLHTMFGDAIYPLHG